MEVPPSTPNQSLQPPHRRAWSPALLPQRADEEKNGDPPLTPSTPNERKRTPRPPGSGYATPRKWVKGLPPAPDKDQAIQLLTGYPTCATPREWIQ